MIVCYPPGTNWSCAYDDAEFAQLDADKVELAEALAWMSLSSLTGGQIAFCPVTVRPCRVGCGAPGTWMVAPVLSTGNFAGVRPGLHPFAPYIGASGAWVNSCGCLGTNDCSCSQLDEAILPGNVGDIVEVWLNGEVMDPTSYRVDKGNRLVRLDGEPWPACQDLAQDAHGPNAFSVTYYMGTAPNNVILYAAGLLAAEFYKGCTGEECALPKNVVNYSRQGVAIELEAGLFPGGRTNIPAVDALIQVYNPHGLTTPPIIASPDTIRRRARMATWGV